MSLLTLIEVIFTIFLITIAFMMVMGAIIFLEIMHYIQLLNLPNYVSWIIIIILPYVLFRLTFFFISRYKYVNYYE